MAMQRLDRDDIVRSIRLQIVSRTIGAGETVDEVRIADSMGLSRTPIREIVNRLAGLGVLVHHRGTGFRTPVFGLPEIKSFFGAALHIYPEVFARAAQNRRDRDLEAMENALDTVAQHLSPHDLLPRLAAYREMVRAGVGATQNDVYLDIMDRLTDQHMMIRMDHVESMSMADYTREIEDNLDLYRRMHVLIRDGESDRVARLSEKFLTESRELIVSQLF